MDVISFGHEGLLFKYGYAGVRDEPSQHRRGIAVLQSFAQDLCFGKSRLCALLKGCDECCCVSALVGAAVQNKNLHKNNSSFLVLYLLRNGETLSEDSFLNLQAGLSTAVRPASSKILNSISALIIELMNRL